MRGWPGCRPWWRCAAQGYAGPLTLLGAEADPPYDRPPLTKELLLGDTDDTTLEADWAALDVDLRLGVAGDCGRAPARADDGRRRARPSTRCVLATGAQPRRLPGDAALTLRTADDALALRAALRPGARLVVVGAGWIGAEVATAAVAAGVARDGRRGAGDRRSPARCPPRSASRMLPWWSGVDLRLGAHGRPAVEPDAVHLAGGERLRGRPACWSAIGARP